MGWTVRGSNPGGGDIFRTRPDRPWGPPNLLYNRYRVSFPEVKQPVRSVNHPHLSSAEVKETVDINLYSPCGPSRPLPGRNLTFTFTVIILTSKTTQSVPVVKQKRARNISVRHDSNTTRNIAQLHMFPIRASRDYVSFKYHRNAHL